jgi:hypothetical protein
MEINNTDSDFIGRPHLPSAADAEYMGLPLTRGVTKRRRLSWLTNTAPSYMSPNAGDGRRRGVAGSQPMSTAVHMEPKKTLEI